jgi:hypothetical protein
MAKKKRPHVMVSIASASCMVLSSEAITCPLCQKKTTPNVTHSCKTQSDAAVDVAVGGLARVLSEAFK